MNKFISHLYKGCVSVAKSCEIWIEDFADRSVRWVKGGTSARAKGHGGQAISLDDPFLSKLGTGSDFSGGLDKKVVTEDPFIMKQLEGVDNSLRNLTQKADDLLEEGKHEEALKLYDFVFRHHELDMPDMDKIYRIKELLKKGLDQKALEYAKICCEASVKREAPVVLGIVFDPVIHYARAFFVGKKAELGVDLISSTRELSPKVAVERFELIAKEGNAELAKTYGRKVMLKWEKLTKGEIEEDLQSIFTLGLLSDATESMRRIKGHIQKGVMWSTEQKDPRIYNLKVEDFLRQEMLMPKQQNNNSNTARFFLGRATFGPGDYSEYGMEKTQVGKALEARICTIMTKSEVSAKILRAVHMSERADPQFLLQLFGHNHEEVKGAYIPLFNRVVIQLKMADPEFEGTLVHELCHKLMKTLYGNETNPYQKGDSERIQKFHEAKQLQIKQLEQEVENPSIEYKKAFQILNAPFVSSTRSYDKSEQDRELIVRYPQIVAQGYDSDPEVQRLIAPMKAFWDEYISKDLETFFAKPENKELAESLVSETEGMKLKTNEYAQALQFKLSNKALARNVANHVFVSVLAIMVGILIFQIGRMSAT